MVKMSTSWFFLHIDSKSVTTGTCLKRVSDITSFHFQNGTWCNWFSNISVKGIGHSYFMFLFQFLSSATATVRQLEREYQITCYWLRWCCFPSFHWPLGACVLLETYIRALDIARACLHQSLPKGKVCRWQSFNNEWLIHQCSMHHG